MGCDMMKLLKTVTEVVCALSRDNGTLQLGGTLENTLPFINIMQRNCDLEAPALVPWQVKVSTTRCCAFKDVLHTVGG